MAAKKTTAKKTAANEAPALAPRESLNYQAAVRGVEIPHLKYTQQTRGVAFIYNGGCINSIERDALACLIAVRHQMLPIKVRDDIAAYTAVFLTETEKYKRMKAGV